MRNRSGRRDAAPASPARSGFRPGRNLARTRYRPDARESAPWLPGRESPDPARIGTSYRTLEVPGSDPAHTRARPRPGPRSSLRLWPGQGSCGRILTRPPPRAERGRPGGALRTARQMPKRRGSARRTGREDQASGLMLLRGRPRTARHGALRRVVRLAEFKIGAPPDRHARETPPSDGGAGRDVLREPPHIGQDASHVFTVVGQGRTVHRPLFPYRIASPTGASGMVLPSGA